MFEVLSKQSEKQDKASVFVSMYASEPLVCERVDALPSPPYPELLAQVQMSES